MQTEEVGYKHVFACSEFWQQSLNSDFILRIPFWAFLDGEAVRKRAATTRSTDFYTKESISSTEPHDMQPGGFGA